MNTTSRPIYFMLLVLFLGTSCVSQKKLTYLRDVTPEMADSINKVYNPEREARIKCGDLLTITVNALDEEAVHAFNLLTASYQRIGSDKVNNARTLQYYTVDRNGEIDFPVIGKIKLEGLRISEARDTLVQLISASVHDPIVNIHFVDYYVTILGEVQRPGKHAVTNERVTILEALAMAGDMTIYGKRNTVLVSRENNGKLEFARLNLNDESLFASPFYYLQQNDVVYVEPNIARGRASINSGFYLSVISTLCSTTTVILSVVKMSK